VTSVDAVIIGSGPNGLAAAVTLALAGRSVVVYEHGPQIGGGLRSGPLAEEGFVHDLCASVHPLGVASPFFRSLTEKGLLSDLWRYAEVEFAHPLDDGRAGVAMADVTQTAADLGVDARRYERLVAPVAARMDAVLSDVLRPPLAGLPSSPVALATLGIRSLWPATWLFRAFDTDEARGLLAGCAGHAIMALNRPVTSAFAVLFAATAHARRWPLVAGGSGQLAAELAAIIEANGGRFETSRTVTSLDQLPSHRVALFDTNPAQVAAIADQRLSDRDRRRLTTFRHGPGVFKIDYTLDGPMPWTNADCRRALTVHVGGTAPEVVHSEREMARGNHGDRPFVLAVQPAVVDPGRAPEGRGILWAYCHVPAHSTVDMTRRIEDQIERFAPGFRDLVRTRTTTTPTTLEARNPNCVGGDIGGGAMTGTQLLLRPSPTRRPYDTSNPAVLLCSASASPGAGVHGMAGHHAAKRALETVLA
jgi:phytoene dehydrogenase-like protein